MCIRPNFKYAYEWVYFACHRAYYVTKIPPAWLFCGLLRLSFVAQLTILRKYHLLSLCDLLRLSLVIELTILRTSHLFGYFLCVLLRLSLVSKLTILRTSQLLSYFPCVVCEYYISCRRAFPPAWLFTLCGLFRLSLVTEFTILRTSHLLGYFHCVVCLVYLLSQSLLFYEHPTCLINFTVWFA